MSNKELIELIDDLVLAALKCDLAQQNFEKSKEELEKVSSKFNNEVRNIEKEELLTNPDFTYKVELANKIFEILNIDKIGGLYIMYLIDI